MGLLSFHATIVMGLALALTPSTRQAVPGEPTDRLLDAIAQVETRNDSAVVGDDGRAVGVYQIHRSYWADATRILGVDWEYADAKDPQKARAVVRAYLRHYGGGKTLLEMARIHNGGPRGCEKPATLAYARKVEQVLRGNM